MYVSSVAFTMRCMLIDFVMYVFFFNDTATTEIYTYGHTLSLHDALPISLSPMLMNFPTPAKEHSHDPDRPVCRNRRRLCRALAHRHTRHCTDARSRPIVRYRECARLPRNDGRGSRSD